MMLVLFYDWNTEVGESGWEYRNGGETSYLGGSISLSGTTFSGDLYTRTQTTNRITIGPPGNNVQYENDLMFDAHNYFPGVPAADGGDGLRTAAIRFNRGSFSLGTNMITGDPGLAETDRKRDFIDGQLSYVINRFGDNPDQYRFGSLYIGVGNLQIGRNSGNIRHTIQNELAHDRLIYWISGEKSPHFRVTEEEAKGKWYIYYGSGTGNTLW